MTLIRYIAGCIEEFSSNVALPHDLQLPLTLEQPPCGFGKLYHILTTCVLSPELVNAYARDEPTRIRFNIL